MARLLSILACLAAAAAMTFPEYCSKYNKQYSGAEFNLRQEIFLQNVARIARHNAEGHSWTMGLNQFADLMTEEWLSATGRGGKKAQNKARLPNLTTISAEELIASMPTIPASVGALPLLRFQRLPALRTCLGLPPPPVRPLLPSLSGSFAATQP